MTVNLDDLVVFLSPEQEPFSMDPRWNDSAVREAWKKQQASPRSTDEEEEIEPYDQWTNDELRGELSSRGLSVDGKKADMVARLEADDAKHTKE